MSRIELFSPAKINLFLAVVGRRNDGFHDLVSVVAQTAFGDDLELEERPASRGVELACDAAEIPRDRSNLAWAAAEAFLDRFGIDAGVRIRLRKRIPSGAGFGGGSGNAATTLLGLSRLFGKGEERELAELAATLGSDCPLFLRSGPSILRGRGERIEWLDDRSAAHLEGLKVALFKPSVGVPTAWAYRRLASLDDPYRSACGAEEALDAWRMGTLTLGSFLANSFERPVFAKYPGIAELLQWVREELGAPALLSGSGSGCFALVDSDAAGRLEERVREAWGERAFFQVTTLRGTGAEASGRTSS